MPLSRIARTHLVYQFIILSLVFFGVGYHELVLAQKFALLLLVVPAFLYQLLVLSCCMELIPVPSWMDFSDSSADVIGEERSNIEASPSSVVDEQDTESQEQNDEVPEMCAEPNKLNAAIGDVKACARKYKLRHWKSPNSTTSSFSSPIIVPTKCNSDITSSSNKTKSHESTKNYFFPYRQKRLEQWVGPNANSRPLKIRNCQSSTSIGKHSSKVSKASDVPSNRNLPDSSVRSISTIPEPDLTKRYTFPFRQRHSIDSDDGEMEHSDEFLSTPYWNTVGYSLAVKQEARRRRRSMSSSQLNAKNIDHGYESEKSRDFSQSVEIAPTSIRNLGSSSSSATSPTTLSKMKSNLVYCFSKIKRVNSKNNLNKGLGNKKRSFKSLFQSRENISMEQSFMNFSSPKLKSGTDESKSEFYPAYIPFHKERFEKDVLKRLSELPRN